MSPGKGERRPRSRLVAAGLVTALALAGPLGAVREHPDPTPAPSQAKSEYRLKGAFLYKFVCYTTWPGSAFEDEESPIVVALLGEHAGGREIEEVLSDERVGRRPLLLRRANTLEDCLGVHVVYCLGENVPLEQRLIERLAGAPTLLLSDREDFAERGGTMNFYLQRGKVRFAVNPVGAQRAGLKLSSELLKLARIVEERR